MLDYEATFEPATQTLTGIIKLRIREDVDLKQADPVNQPYPVFEGGD